MAETDGLAWQPSLLDSGALGFDPKFRGLRHRDLADGAWVEEHAVPKVRSAAPRISVQFRHAYDR